MIRCLYCTKLAPISKTNDMARAERVVALNQIVRSTNRPATASLHSATPKRKNVPCSVDFRGGGFFLFGVLPVKIFGQCGEASIRTRFCENYFLGIWIFRKTETNLFLHFVRAEEGSGEESARASFRIFAQH